MAVRSQPAWREDASADCAPYIAARGRPSNGPGRRRPPLPLPPLFYPRSRRDEAGSIVWQPWKTYTRAAVFLQRERAVGPARPSMTSPARFTAEGR